MAVIDMIKSFLEKFYRFFWPTTIYDQVACNNKDIKPDGGPAWCFRHREGLVNHAGYGRRAGLGSMVSSAPFFLMAT
ncbi:hypothetical protein HMPREF0513_00684 [Limosilactobacillus fermentum 28-3-CHN]|nr:hypothetical protein HMPREF0513_00684 [Limosilactobacillus fermentum 28-3-CHN]ESS01744.1 hypothetical protein NB22_03015 [Limosilactobacillus fermentum NB-22]BAG27933.1 hypothetical protein LAF_1597 [Limosilactobacillus fermentum IFO 3956]CDI68517.1 Putative uncharacterized protein [Limosilactobacillus fermentum L930BB]